MPWTIDDIDRFKKGLTPREKKRWVKIANAVLKKSGDEGKAIRIASSRCDENTKLKPSIVDTFDIGNKRMINVDMPFGKKKRKRKK